MIVGCLTVVKYNDTTVVMCDPGADTIRLQIYHFPIPLTVAQMEICIRLE
jgi:hypothetical protein